MVTLPLRLEREGCALAYSDSGGDGRAVLFLHGAGADSVMFEHQASALVRSGHRVVLWELRAHGRSRPNDAPITANLLMQDAEALLAALELDRPVLVGHSLGGNIAQELVRRYPTS